MTRLGNNDQAAVVFMMNSKKSQAVTTDHFRLETAIASTTFGGKVKALVEGADLGNERYDIASAW